MIDPGARRVFGTALVWMGHDQADAAAIEGSRGMSRSLFLWRNRTGIVRRGRVVVEYPPGRARPEAQLRRTLARCLGVS